MSEAHVSVDVAQQARFCFEVAFAGTTLAPVLTDEPPPLGDGPGAPPQGPAGNFGGGSICASNGRQGRYPTVQPGTLGRPFGRQIQCLGTRSRQNPNV